MDYIKIKDLNEVDGKSLGVTVKDIKGSYMIDQIGEPQIGLLPAHATFVDGKRYNGFDIRCVADIKLTPRGKTKRVMIVLPFSNTYEMRKIIDEVDGADPMNDEGK